jgi:hypothetical protein
VRTAGSEHGSGELFQSFWSLLGLGSKRERDQGVGCEQIQRSRAVSRVRENPVQRRLSCRCE